MKILFISTDLYSRGGIQRYSRYQLRAFATKFPDAQVSSCSYAPPRSDRFDDGPRVQLTGGRGGVISKLWFIARVLALTARLGPDLIICDHIHLGPLASAASSLGRARLMQFVYAIEVWGDIPALQRRSLLRADRVVSDCEFTKQYLIEKYPKLRTRIRVIRDCVDCDRFKPARPAQPIGSAPDVPLTLLTVSRLAEGRSKGHQRVMEAMVELRGSAPAIHYLIAGDGADRGRLEAEAARLGLSDSVVFLGAISEPHLPEVYNSCDIFVLLSAFQLTGHRQGEGVPLVVLEAQACGKPVITSSRDGSAESIIDGQTGMLVDPEDVSQIADGIRLLSNERLRSRMGEAARLRAVQECSFEVFAGQLSAAVLDLIG